MLKWTLITVLLATAQKQCGQSYSLHFINATSQNWMGGPAATRGTYYKIYFQLGDTAGYSFDSLWVSGIRLPLSWIGSSSPGDTLLLMANDYRGIRNPMNQQDVSNAVHAPFPVASEAAGLLGYSIKGKRAYLEILKWEQLKPLYHQ